MAWRIEEAPPCYAFNSVPSSFSDPELLFYDGHCGLCHRTVKFVIARDGSGKLFRFAPLQGPTFKALVPTSRRAGLPDSLMVLTQEDALLVRSDAVLHILRRLGGGWKIVAAAVAVVPRPIRDAAYYYIARIRYGVVGRRDDLCPVVPAELRARFDP
ncbi:MAG: thiol-disulfide oxidoreductase DCC family protein [Candidatus Acidiferrales bacterium]